VFIAVTVSVMAFALLVIFAASEQDKQALEFETTVLRKEISNFPRDLSVLASDNAWWDTAVEKIIFQEDLEWLEGTIGTTARDISFVDGAIVTRPDLSVIYAAHSSENDDAVLSTNSLLSSELGKVLGSFYTTAKPTKSEVSGLILINGHLVAYSTSLVRASDEELFDPRLGRSQAALTFYSVLSQPEIDSAGHNGALQGLAFSVEQPENKIGCVPVENIYGATIGWLAWSPREPGTEMALDLVIPALILLGLLVVAMIHFTKRANSLIEGLEKASKSKSSFLASMSHEVRTPLNSILGFSELMALELFGKIEGKKNKEYLQLIQTSGGHLLSIINDILDISKLEAGKFDIYAEEIQPNSIIDECIRMIEPAAQDRNITITHKCAAAKIFSDERIIRQILINILSNAIKFTKQGGAVHINGETNNDHYVIQISDNGMGMNASEIEIALSTFGQVQNEYSKSHSGTGLGLPLVKRFIALLDGQMDITSNPGKGTTVTLKLPIRTTAKNI